MKRWTREEDAVVMQAHSDQVRMKAVGEQLGRSYFSVKARIAALGLQRGKPWSSRDLRVLRDMWTAGEKLVVIAVTLGRDDASVRYRRKVLKLPPRPNPARGRV